MQITFELMKTDWQESQQICVLCLYCLSQTISILITKDIFFPTDVNCIMITVVCDDQCNVSNKEWQHCLNNKLMPSTLSGVNNKKAKKKLSSKHKHYQLDKYYPKFFNWFCILTLKPYTTICFVDYNPNGKAIIQTSLSSHIWGNF